MFSLRIYFLYVFVLKGGYSFPLKPGVDWDEVVLSDVFFTFTLGSEDNMPRLAKVFADLIEGCEVTPRDVSLYVSFWEDDGSYDPGEGEKEYADSDGSKLIGEEGVLCSVKKILYTEMVI